MRQGGNSSASPTAENSGHSGSKFQITIPNTSTYPRPKPHTRYHISVCLPLHAYVLQKRYSDFTVLQDQFIKVVGQPPPSPLPKKHFLASTFNNPRLIEERRKGLEEYLQAIVTAPDPQWHDSLPWGTFLNLPIISNANRKDGQVAPEGDWFDIHKHAKTLLQESRQHLNQWTTALTIKDQHSAAAATKCCLILAMTKVTSLQSGLNTLETSFNIGISEGEIRRRRDLIRELNTEIVELERLSQFIASQRAMLSIANASEPQNQLFNNKNPARTTLDPRIHATGIRHARQDRPNKRP